MSAITGKPTRVEIYSYLSSLKENGIEQALLYPRSGCEIEYLSDEWFLTIGNFIECAKELDMNIWLYDDFNWPSGDCGGRVSIIPEYRLMAISTNDEDFGKICCESKHNSGLFGEKYFPNLLSNECVDYFIKCTHEEYYKRFKDYFGSVIKGIFTDEPSIGYSCKNGYIPYYVGMENDYFELYKRDFFKDMSLKSDEFFKNAITLISNRFKCCYIDKLASWCKEHGILLTGHLMCDNEPFWSTIHNGNILKNLSSISLPGIDEIETSFENKTEMALFGVIEYAKSENGKMAELFALGPSDMTYAKKRAMLYLSACHKIDNYFLAISHMDMRGNMLVKDFFNNFSIDQPDFGGMKELAKSAKDASLLAKKDFIPDLYIRFPFALCAENITKWIDLTPLFDLINSLTFNQIQWKFIDDEVALDAPIIEIGKDLSFRINGSLFDISKLSKKPLVLDKDKKLPTGIFVRRFLDNEFVVINLFSYEGEYFIDKKSVYLAKHDVYLSSKIQAEYKALRLDCDFNIEYKNDNVIRLMYVNSKPFAKIDCEDDFKLSFAIRNNTEAQINNEKILVNAPADFLPKGMKMLYKKSNTITLSKGINKAFATNDIKYMPSLLVSGDFSYKILNSDYNILKLSKRKSTYKCGEKFTDYGSVDFSSYVEIPYGAKGIRLKDTNLFTKIYLDDILLGEKCFSPYIYNIDKSLWERKALLKITQYSSIAPIFGDVAYWDKEILECGWRGTPSPTNIPFGFTIEWIF